MRIHTLSSLLLTAVLGCANAKPVVLCTLENPSTGARVEMYKEIAFKVPANYDEAKHIESWKADQAAKGFTREVK